MSRKWICPTGDEWDKYLLTSDMSGRSELEKHLAECPQCRFYIAQRQKELSDLQQVWDNSIDPDIIYLSPAESDINSLASIKTLLAAEGNRKRIGVESVTLSSPDQKVLFRAVRDYHTGEIWLYVIADEPELFQNVLVKPFGSDREYVTDEKGRVNLGKVAWPETDRLTAEVHLPKASFTLKSLEEPLEAGKSIELSSPGGDKIKALFSGEGRNRRLSIQLVEITKDLREIPIKIAIRGKNKIGLYGIDADINLSDLKDSEILEIFLYQ
jgi:hypothetical protein